MAKVFRYHVLEVLSVHDGDTCTLLLDLGFDIHRIVTVRLQGLDAPEVRGQSREAGLRVKALVHGWLAGRQLELLSASLDKYGRVLGDLYDKDESLCAFLLESGLVKPYAGGERPTWTQDDFDAILKP